MQFTRRSKKSADVIKSEELMKRGAGFFDGFKQRYFEISLSKGLSWWPNENDRFRPPKGSVALDDMLEVTRVDAENIDLYSFNILTKEQSAHRGRTFELCTKNRSAGHTFAEQLRSLISDGDTSERPNRGPCVYCQKLVYTDQPRMVASVRKEDGSRVYVHNACLDQTRATNKPDSDAVTAVAVPAPTDTAVTQDRTNETAEDQQGREERDSSSLAATMSSSPVKNSPSAATTMASKQNKFKPTTSKHAQPIKPGSDDVNLEPAAGASGGQPPPLEQNVESQGATTGQQDVKKPVSETEWDESPVVMNRVQVGGTSNYTPFKKKTRSATKCGESAEVMSRVQTGGACTPLKKDDSDEAPVCDVIDEHDTSPTVAWGTVLTTPRGVRATPDGAIEEAAEPSSRGCCVAPGRGACSACSIM